MASPHSRGKGYSSEPHHFFEVVLESTIRDGKLGIPRKFARDHGNALSSPVFFKVPNGEVWEVELTKSDGKMWLQNGWQKFAEHYSLTFGYFLVFRYEGNCRFHVLIFDRSASEIHYPYANDNEEIQQQEAKIEESEEEDDSVQIINNISTGIRKKPLLQCPRPHKMMRASPSDDETKRSLKFESVAAGFGHNNNGFSAGKCKVRSTTVCRVKSDEKSKALQRASSAFKSENPFFLVFMQPTYVSLPSNRSCYVGIPKDFARKYLMDHGDVILCDSNGKTWSAEYYSILGSNKRPYVKLRSGWGAFVRDNNLQVGDVCAFELINCIDISFQVFIYGGKKADFHGSRAFTDVFCPAKREAGTSSTHRECLEPLKIRETALQSALKAREKALQRSLAFTSENPFFHVVLRPSYVRTHALCISDQFARKHFKSTLTNVDVSLCLSNGKSWPAEYRQRSFGRRNARICNGWRAFVKDNKLKVGDVCVLEMTNDTQISFKVFIFQAIIADANCHPSQGVSQETLDLTSQSPKAAREKASVPPFFRRVVLPLHLKEHRVDIPFRFVEQYLKPNIQKLILQVADRSWAVKIKSNPRFRISKLTSGWIEFARDNFLREGDICVYELDTVSNNLLKVTISKCGH